MDEHSINSINIESKNKKHNNIQLLLQISIITIIISYSYLIIRRIVLLTDSTLREIGLTNSITGPNPLEITTKIVDSFQSIACVTLLIALIIIIVTNKNHNNRYLIAIVIAFSILTILNIIRPIILHLGPDHFILLGFIFNAEYYYDFAFFIYSTDVLRIVISVLLAITTSFFIHYLNVTNMEKTRIRYTTPIILNVCLLLYITEIIIASILYKYENNIELITMFYMHYSIQTLLQLGNIFAFYTILRRSKLV